jgi:D-3-phosphoglycerate dehydrogenase / 2-oxoglutarate reductase
MPELPVIFSTHRLHPKAAAALADAGRLVVADALDPATLVRQGAEASAVIVRAPIPPALFAAAPRLRAAIRHGAGVDMIPLEAAGAAGVLVANVPGVNARSVAEHVVFLTLSLLRRFRPIDRDLRTAGWLAGRAHAETTEELAGRTLGIVGMGSVGRQLAAIAMHGFGLEVLAANRRGGPLPDGVVRVGLEQLAERADIVVLCCPLTAETRGLIGADLLGRMKSSAFLVNVARGPVVDEAALVAALTRGRLAGAALDVFDIQPLPADHPLLDLDNVVITPHLAGITRQSMERMGMGAAAETLRILSGQLPVNLVNPEVLPRYRERFPAAEG